MQHLICKVYMCVIQSKQNHSDGHYLSSAIKINIYEKIMKNHQ
jgi:hypothetical protein